MVVYYTCPSCGYKQRSKAKKRVKCHKCGRSYKKSRVKTTERKSPSDKGTGFFRYKKSDKSE